MLTSSASNVSILNGMIADGHASLHKNAPGITIREHNSSI